MPTKSSAAPRSWLLTLASLILTLWLACPLWAGPELVLMDAQHPPCAIVMDPALDKAQVKAAQDLGKYLKLITGQVFPVRKYDGTMPERAIVVGPVQVEAPADLGPEGYLLRVQDGRLHIVGGGPTGTIYGIYGLLEDHLGCRWWSHNEEEVPRQEQLRLSVDEIQRPAFRSHDLFNREAMASPYKLRTSPNGQDIFTGSHTLCPMLLPYAKEYPEFLPMDKNGKRAYNKLHMDYTAAGMADALATELEKQIVTRKGNVKDWIYFAGMGDWYGGMDLSPQSQAIYAAERWVDPDGRAKPGYIAPLITLMNEVGAKLQAKYPGVQVGTFAYMSLEAPPANVKPASNVVIRVPRLRHATVRSVLESPKNKSFLRNLERWCEIAPGQVYVWEYGASYKNFLMPFPCLYSMAQNIKHYHQMGVKGVMIQGNYASMGGDLSALKNYVWRKLLWNPQLDPRALVEEFCKGYYGPAAEHLSNYVETLEQSVRGEKPSDADEFANPRSYLPAELLAKLRTIMDAAVAATDPEAGPYRRRVLEARASLEAVDLWREPPAKNPFIEEDGKLIRSDLKEYTYPRAVELIKHLRGGGAGEWAGARAYQMTFLNWHGGPIATLDSDAAQLKVAPALAGKVGPLTVGGKTACEASYVYVSSGKFRTAQWHQEPQPKTVWIAGDAAVSLWGGVTKHLVRQQIDALGSGSYHFQEWSRQAPGTDATMAKSGGRVESIYQVGPKLAQIAVARWSPQLNAWEKVDLQPLIDAPAPGAKDPWPSFRIAGDKLRLYRAGVEVEDSFAILPAMATPEAPAPIHRWELAYHAKNGQLKITTIGPTIAVTPKEERLCLDRTLTVRLADAPSPAAATQPAAATGPAPATAPAGVGAAAGEGAAEPAVQNEAPRDELPKAEADPH